MDGEWEHPEAVRLVVVFLRDYARLSQTQLGRAAGVRQAYLSELESGTKKPSEAVLRRLAAAADVPWSLVAHLRRFYSAFVAAKSKNLDLLKDYDSVSTTSPMAVHAYLLEEAAPPDSQEADQLQAELIWKRVSALPQERRERAIKYSPRASRSGALVRLLCQESESAAAEDPTESLNLAELALAVAERVPEEKGSRHLRGFAWAHKANALRAAGKLAEASHAFHRAWASWKTGTGHSEASVPEWRMLSMEASLRRAERHFPEALALLSRAREVSGGHPNALAVILLNEESVFEQSGDLPGALRALEEAARYVETSSKGRLLLALRFKLTNNLCHLGRELEAAELLPSVRDLAQKLGNELDVLRVDWLESRVLANLGRSDEATALLEKVRREFSRRGNAYNAALASLDLAVLYLKEGRLGKVKTLAYEMTEIFKAQRIDREALAALSLFREAAQRETATVELVRRVIAQIERAGREMPTNESLSSH